ncbi:isochorismate synthase [Microbacterium sp. SSW1-59]|uniref:isochorismate synthase n=1 Tax=Microbacterium xanthum TaxID=3079794 RepID=UPI002AD36D3D|nr:isochorismate synthase [Microbacterium sp. SSW1-59]MDZ8200145.1 isochorismate synthase [Microbacterium sp. SSW1-59]
MPVFPRLLVETREIDPVDDLLAYADPDRPLAWLRRGDGVVGLGDLGGYERAGADAGTAPTATADAWRDIAAAAEVDDPVGIPGTGLVAFGALTFDRRSQWPSRLVVPDTVIGRRDGRSWLTRIRRADDHDGTSGLPRARAFGPSWSGTLGPGSLDPEGYQAAVRAALSAIADGEVGKVVLARDLVGTLPAGADLRRLVRALSEGYPDTWTFAVDGLIGASPETLVTVAEGRVSARVLAGTVGRGPDHDDDDAAAQRLLASAKDRDEHRFAVRSVVEALAPHTRTLAADEEPFALELPNLWHLATDVDGVLGDDASSLDLVAALHPTAAVAGTPTEAAMDVIRRLEPFDRGRYAGPVGWVDGDGDGEWAIALRCAQVEGRPSRRFGTYRGTIGVTAFAGAGIVAGSDPESEMLETRVKFRPIVDALA